MDLTDPAFIPGIWIHNQCSRVGEIGLYQLSPVPSGNTVNLDLILHVVSPVKVLTDPVPG